MRLRIDYEQMNAFFADYTRNISKGSTFIKTSRPLEVGSRCQFSLSLPALPVPLVLEGEVVWILSAEAAQQSGAKPGMGIRFVYEGNEQRQSLEELVEKMMIDSLGPLIYSRLVKKTPKS